jgi:5-formyltetrahydrofolate cyclo-ligase
MTDSLQRQKNQIRMEALRRRDQLQDGETLSRCIFERLANLPEYQLAQTVMVYLDIRSEVRTQCFLSTLWAAGKKVVVPYCHGDELGLFHLKSCKELAPGAMQIPEPASNFRKLAERQVPPEMLDFIIVPGVAFDRHGARIGYGKGYYDKLLQSIRKDAIAVGVCFECQLFPEIPCLSHDVRMSKVVTESAVYSVE